MVTCLLHEHDEERRLRCTSVPRNGEHLAEQMLALAELLLHLQGSMNIVQVPSSLERGRAEFAERLVRVVVAVAHHVPPRRLGTKVDLHADKEGSKSNRQHMRMQRNGLLTERRSTLASIAS